MKVGDGIQARNASWTFEGVGEQFDEHVARSVPLYREGHELIAKAADYFLPEDSLCYDLGCSTGALLARLAERNAGRRVRFVGIDREPSMTRKARERCAGLPVEIMEGDLLELPLEPAEAVLAYYTMQFVPARSRQAAFDRVYQALKWGGAFFCFEKVRAPDARFQDLVSGIYVEHKIDQGYGFEEIVGKARSLKGVLEPFSTEGNLGLLRRSGFVDIMSIFKYACFEGFLAIK